MTQPNWLTEALAVCPLDEATAGYCYGRGVKDEFLANEGVKTWQPTATPVPEEHFTKAYGAHGERLAGYMACPMWSPKGTLIGCEFRTTMGNKNIQDYRLPNTRWAPFFLGMKQAMPKVWAGGSVWIVEGLFDLAPLDWVIPKTDAVLATVRAKLSDQHVAFLRRFMVKGAWVHMCYDKDETGRKATVGWNDAETGKRRYGALEALQRVGLPCRDVPYSGGKDPGELWDAGGIKAIRKMFAPD